MNVSEALAAKPGKFRDAVAMGVRDHRSQCTTCRYELLNPKKYGDTWTWVHCSSIQPLVDLWNLIG